MQIYNYLLSKGYEKRKTQELMFSLVSEYLESEDRTVPLLIEAPTGTGKTFGYLIPILENEEKAIISTGTKVLQEQLRNDIETLSAIKKTLYGKAPTYLIIKGKSNYLCLDRFYEQKNNILSSLEIENLIESSSWDGDFEFTNVSSEEWEKINIDEDYCDSSYLKRCPYKDSCFYYSKLKKKEDRADILVINHSLLSLKEIDSSKERVLIVDEAHELDRYLTLASRTGITTYLIYQIANYLNKINQEDPIDIPLLISKIDNILSIYFRDEDDTKDIPLIEFTFLEDFETQIISPLKEHLKKAKKKVEDALKEYLKDTFFVTKSFIDYLKDNNFIDKDFIKEGLEIKNESFTKGESSIIFLIKDLLFAQRKLEKSSFFLKFVKKEDTKKTYGFILSRRKSKKLNSYNYVLEAFPIFPVGLLNEDKYNGIIFTSATLDEEDMKICLGIEGKYVSLPPVFDYSKIRFLIKNTNPKREDWKQTIKDSYKLIRSLHDKILVLMTNREHMKLIPKEEGVCFQNDKALSLMLKDLQEGDINVIVGLDSIWTGIDVKGEKGMIITKIPFESPDDPISYHRLRFLRENGIDEFTYSLRKALIKFKQGFGRLIRSKTDKGTIIFCDNRIWRYKEFIEFLKKLDVKIEYEKNIYR